MKNILSSLTLVFLSTPVVAQDISLGEPAYGGTGCPAGTAAAVLSEDARSLSIIFDQYVSEAGGTTGRTFERKSCNVAIPVRVPNGYSVSVFAVDYRGYNYLPTNSSAEFNVEYFFAGSRGPSFRRTFRGPSEANYLIRNDLIASSVVWSGCGDDVILRTNSSIRVASYSGRQAYSSVDSQDVQAALVYHLAFRQCQP